MKRTLLQASALALLPVAASADDLAGTGWRLEALVSFDDSIGTILPPDPNAYTLEFGTDGRAAMRLDCNRGGGAYTETAEGGLTFGPMAMTRALCPEGSLDSRIGREMGFVRSFVVEDYHLNLSLMADGGLQVWTRMP